MTITTTPRKAYRLAGRSTSAQMCGARFANPTRDENLPTPTLVCTCEPGHEPPHVAHVGDLPAAVAFDTEESGGARARSGEGRR